MKSEEKVLQNRRRLRYCDCLQYILEVDLASHPKAHMLGYAHQGQRREAGELNTAEERVSFTSNHWLKNLSHERLSA
jgi:hypothetical protein